MMEIGWSIYPPLRQTWSEYLPDVVIRKPKSISERRFVNNKSLWVWFCERRERAEES